MEISEQKDWEIIGFIISGYIGCFVITLCLCFFIKNVMRDSEIAASMKYPALLSFISSLLYCLMVGFLRTNFLFGNLDFNYQSFTCRFLFGITYTFYAWSKFSMYILFTYRLEIVFDQSMYQVSHKRFQILRFIMIILAIMFTVLSFFANTQQIITPKFKISLCTRSDEINIGSIVTILFTVCDLFISLCLLWIFSSKLYKMSKLLLLEHTTANISNKPTDNIVKKIECQLIKATILVSICIVSSLLFVIIGTFFWWSMGWFIPLDMTINTLSIYLMYKCSRKLYLFCCYPCIACCRVCVITVDHKIFMDLPSSFKSRSRAGTVEIENPIPTPPTTSITITTTKTERTMS